MITIQCEVFLRLASFKGSYIYYDTICAYHSELFFIFRVKVTLGHFIEIRLFLTAPFHAYFGSREFSCLQFILRLKLLASEYKFLHGPLSLMDFK